MKVAVVIPCYNSMEFVDECLDSVLNQDYDNLQIYVYDNESQDGTVEHVRKRSFENDKISVVSVKNLYPNSYREAFEHAFENVDADYLTFIASDDYIAPNYISNCVNIISKNPNKILCIQSPIVGVQGGIETNMQKHTYKSMSEFKNLCLQKSPVNTPTVIYHKSLYKYLKMSAHIENNIICSGAEDYDMYCCLADNGVFIYPVPAHLGYYYRWHKNQCTWSVHKDPNNYDKIIQNYWKNKWTT
jgi:glycosyltransferase involved in cell wall biosynthesis